MGVSETRAPARQARRSRWAYYRRVFAAYALGGGSHLTFWHGTPQVNEESTTDSVGQYYMPFLQKAAYPGPYDQHGIPLLDYRGDVGEQYNPIAIAQYGLGNYNLWKRSGAEEGHQRFLKVAQWLVQHLEPNPWSIPVWNHHFDWEYREVLKAPWYSALAQGQGISLLVRAHLETGDDTYLNTARQAFRSLDMEIEEGGVRHTDSEGHVWLEETVVDPPTHILNGFMWAIWGLHDYALHTGDARARELYGACIDTLKATLHRFDLGFWSLYELAGTRLPMVASPFYHSLHIVQLRVMDRLHGDPLFQQYADRWQGYQRHRYNRVRSLFQKGLFKLFYY